MNIQDYSNWTYQMPNRPTKADWERLRNRLNAYVGSTKFLREGSTIDQYDQYTGKRVKVPIQDVIYKKNLNDRHGISAEHLRQQIKAAVRGKDKDALKDVSQYRFFQASRFKSPKQIAKQQDKKRRKRVLIGSIALGGGGLLLGLIPLLEARKQKALITRQVLGQAAATSVAGGVLGLTATGLLDTLWD